MAKKIKIGLFTIFLLFLFKIFKAKDKEYIEMQSVYSKLFFLSYLVFFPCILIFSNFRNVDNFIENPNPFLNFSPLSFNMWILIISLILFIIYASFVGYSLSFDLFNDKDEKILVYLILGIISAIAIYTLASLVLFIPNIIISINPSLLYSNFTEILRLFLILALILYGSYLVDLFSLRIKNNWIKIALAHEEPSFSFTFKLNS